MAADRDHSGFVLSPSRSTAAEQPLGSLTLTQLESSLLGLVQGGGSPSISSETTVLLPLELSPIYFSLRLAVTSQAQEAARVYWFSSGRPRALFSPEAAVLYLKQTIQVLRREVSSNCSGLGSTVSPATLFHVEVPSRHWVHWAAIICAASDNL